MSAPGGAAAPLPDAGWEVEVGELVVGRGWSWKPEPLQRSAERDYIAKSAAQGQPPPYYSISTFGCRREATESTDDAVARVLAQMHEHGVRAKFAALTTATELRDAGFDLQLSEPPPGHYDLPLGLKLNELRTADLARVLDARERRRMPR